MKINFFCINLKKRTDRWKAFRESTTRAGIKINKIGAVTIPKYPEMGCALSHRKIIQIAKIKKMPYVCVFEDDIYIHKPEKFIKEIEISMKELPSNWSILYFGGLIGREGILKKYSNHLLRVTGLMCTYGIIYNSNIYDTILKTIPNNWTGVHNINGYRAIDNWLAQEIQKKNNCFITKRLLVSERSNYSDIEKRWKSTEIRYKFLFFMYKAGLGKLFKVLGKIGDLLNISTRKKYKSKHL